MNRPVVIHAVLPGAGIGVGDNVSLVGSLGPFGSRRVAPCKVASVAPADIALSRRRCQAGIAKDTVECLVVGPESCVVPARIDKLAVPLASQVALSFEEEVNRIGGLRGGGCCRGGEDALDAGEGGKDGGGEGELLLIELSVPTHRCNTKEGRLP